MNNEMLETMLRNSLAARAEHVPYGDLAQRAIRRSREKAAMQLVRLRRMNQGVGLVAMVLIAGVLFVGYRRYSIIATNWASSDAASTLQSSTISTTWISFQSPAMVAMMLAAAVIVILAIVWQFVGDDPRTGVHPLLG